jgi:cytochrome c
MRLVILTMALLLLTGCMQERHKEKLDGGTLIKQKCAMCHNLAMPPSTYEDEKAPPMMAVAFHLKDFMHIETHADASNKMIPFIQDYVIDPSATKSYCDKESLKTYGVMPSQKDNVTQDELEAIGWFMYDFYDQQKFLKQMQEKAAFNALPKAQQLLVKKGCLNCHSIEEDKIAPSFTHIGASKERQIISVIQKGSKDKWKGFNHMLMPSYKGQFTQDELETLKEWMENLGAVSQSTQWKVKNAI